MQLQHKRKISEIEGFPKALCYSQKWKKLLEDNLIKNKINKKVTVVVNCPRKTE